MRGLLLIPAFLVIFMIATSNANKEDCEYHLHRCTTTKNGTIYCNYAVTHCSLEHLTLTCEDQKVKKGPHKKQVCHLHERKKKREELELEVEQTEIRTDCQNLLRVCDLCTEDLPICEDVCSRAVHHCDVSDWITKCEEMKIKHPRLRISQIRSCLWLSYRRHVGWFYFRTDYFTTEVTTIG